MSTTLSHHAAGSIYASSEVGQFVQYVLFHEISFFACVSGTMGSSRYQISIALTKRSSRAGSSIAKPPIFLTAAPYASLLQRM